MERRISFLLTAILSFICFPLILFSASSAAGQTASGDTTSAKQSASASASIIVKIVSDSTTVRNDSLTGSQDTAREKKDTVAAKKDTLEIITSSGSYNTVPGFRIQLLTTQNLSEAIGMKAKADSLLANYNIYIVYDSPYYKVRVGDFRARYEANQAIGYIADHGFPNAWSVPDNVFRNPQRKTN